MALRALYLFRNIFLTLNDETVLSFRFFVIVNRNKRSLAEFKIKLRRETLEINGVLSSTRRELAF